VPQLIKLNFEAMIEGEKVPADVLSDGGIAGFGCDLVVKSYEFYDETTNMFIFEQGKKGADAFNLSAGDDSSPAFEFDKSSAGGWYYELKNTAIISNSLSIKTPTLLNYNKSIGYACHDGIITCGLKYRSYQVD